MRVALIEDGAQAITRSRTGEDARRDRRRVRMRDVHHGRRLRSRHPMRLDERGAKRAEESLARGEPAFAGVHRTERLGSKKQRARDRAPSSERVLYRRLADDEVGVPRIQEQAAARGRRAMLVLREPCDELANGALVLEPDVHLARLRRVAASRAPLVDAQRRAVAGDRVQATPRDDRFQQAELQQTLRGRVSDRRLDRSQGGHERCDIARRVQRGDRVPQRLRSRIRAETLDELPVRHATRL